MKVTTKTGRITSFGFAHGHRESRVYANGNSVMLDQEYVGRPYRVRIFRPGYEPFIQCFPTVTAARRGYAWANGRAEHLPTGCKVIPG